MTKPNLAVVSSAGEKLAFDVMQYREEHDLAAADLARESGVSVYAVRAIEKGVKASRKNTRKLRDFLEARATSSSEFDGIDAASHALATRVVALAGENGRHEGVYNTAARQLFESLDPEAGKAEARKMLVKLLASMTSVDARIDFLMNLRDIVKEKK